MATTDSREVTIEATPAEILDVIADVEATPTWSPQYSKSEILETFPDGRPKQAKMTVKAAGITDEQVIEYTWTDSSVTWTLLSSSSMKAQDAGYTLTADGDQTRVRFDMTIDLSVPLWIPVTPEPGQHSGDAPWRHAPRFLHWTGRTLHPTPPEHT